MNKIISATAQTLHRSIGKIVFLGALPLLWAIQKNEPRLRAVVIDKDRRILLVRNWIGSQQWELPGGGRKHSESPETAVTREIKEETGVTVSPHTLTLIGHHTTPRRLSPLALTIYATSLDALEETSGHSLEIIEAAWFPLDSLPSTCDETVTYAIKAASAILINR